MSRALLIFLLASFALVFGTAGLASAQMPASGGRTYSIQAKLIDNGRLVGAPGLIVREGQPATMNIATDGGYAIWLVAHEQPLSAYGRRVAVSSAVYLWSANHWKYVASPELTVPIGKMATFEVARPTRRDGAAGNAFRIEMTVRDVASSSPKVEI